MKTIRYFCIGCDFLFRTATAAVRSTLSRFTLSTIYNFVWCRSHNAVVFCDPTKTTTKRLHVSPLSSYFCITTKQQHHCTSTTQNRTNDWHTQNAASHEWWKNRTGGKLREKKNYDSTANECDVFFLFSRSNWHEILLTWRSQRKQITKRFPVVFNIDYNIDSELATIAVVGQSAGLASGDSSGDHIFI